MSWQSAYSLIEVERSGQVTIVRFIARTIVEEKAIRMVGDELIRLLEKFGNKNMVLSFGEVKNLSSYILATLVKLQKKVKDAGGHLALCCIDPEVYQVFELTRLNRIFSIYPDEPSAMKSF
jgi:anti-sigma B factor antagonist